MRKGLKISLWGLGTVVVLLMAIVLLGPSIFLWIMAPNHRFGESHCRTHPTLHGGVGVEIGD